jgi:hypothetical protein
MNTDNFFSVERLIEFGVGMGIAQQMVQSMNNALQQAYQPSTMTTHLNSLPLHSDPIKFLAVLEGKQAGPFNGPEVLRLVANGKITKSTYIWRDGMPKWEFAENVPEFMRIFALAPPPLPSCPPPPPTAG